MSKLAVGITVLTLGTATSVGGVYLQDWIRKQSNIPKTLDEFKNTNGGNCVQSVFKGIKSMKSTTSGDDFSTSENIFTTSEGNSEYTGCLVVNWDKYTSTEESKANKGKANFRFLWAMAKGNEGFIVFAVADTKVEGTDKKWDGKGVAYKMKQNNNEGTIEKKKEVSSGKTIKADDSDDKFPTLDVQTSLEGIKKSSNSFWGLEESKDKMKENIDSEIEESKSTHTQFRGYWIWEKGTGGSEKTADQWSSKFDGWGNEVYGTDTCNLKTKLAEVKGKGTNRSLNPSSFREAQPEPK